MSDLGRVTSYPGFPVQATVSEVTQQEKNWINKLHTILSDSYPSKTQEGSRKLRFRTTKSPYSKKLLKKSEPPTRIGLETFNASGSAQMSEVEIQQLRDRIPDEIKLYLVDLQRADYYFINGMPVSIRDKGSNRVTMRNCIDKTRTIIDRVALPEKRETESDIARKYNITPIRIRAKEEDIKNPDNVQEFLDFVDTIRSTVQTCWIHLHCAAGYNRTTTYFMMLDMLFNADKVSLEDFYHRHHYLGGADLQTKPDHQINRELLEQFYGYAQQRIEGPVEPWSQYLKRDQT